MDILKYTDQELAKNFALLENHLKQAPSGDEDFCEDCINKHLLLIEGLAEEGMNIENPEKYQKVYDFAKSIRGKDYQKYGVELSKRAREIRKSLSTCSTCTLTKDLNNIDSYDNDTHNSTGHISDLGKLNGEPKNNMVEKKYTEIMYIGAGQLAAEGVRYAVDAYKPAWTKYVGIGGGAVLTLLPMFVKKLPNAVKTISMVAGTNLLAKGIVDMIRGTTTPTVVRAGVARAGNGNGNGVARAGNNVARYGQPNGRVFGGPVTATNIPTQYARAGILGGAQAFESPEHADLIRVD